MITKNFTKPAFTATLGLAIVLTFSCSTGDDGGGSSTNSHNDGVSSGTDEGNSSSSVKNQSLSSSSLDVEECTFQDTRNENDVKTYKCVKIGDKTWMAENLNVKMPRLCYDNNPENCETYGGLYNQPTNTCNPHCTGALLDFCPVGWELPSNEDWQQLADLIGTQGFSGNDDYGFAALPGGYLETPTSGDDEYTGLGEIGSWLSRNLGEHTIDTWRMTSNSLERIEQPLSSKHSIRCVKH